MAQSWPRDSQIAVKKKSPLLLLLNVWIWYRWTIQMSKINQNYHHDGEQLSKHTGWAKTRMFFVLQETRNYNFYKNSTQDNIKCHIQQEESWLRWIVINYLILYKEHYCLFYDPFLTNFYFCVCIYVICKYSVF